MPKLNPTVCIIGDKEVESDLKLLEAAKHRFSNVFFVPLSGIRISLEDKEGAILYRSQSIKKFDIIIPRILQKDSFFAYQLLSLFPDETYLAIRPLSYLVTQNRFFLLSFLRQHGVATLTVHMAKTPSAALRILNKVKFPISLRIPDAETVMIARNLKEAKTQIDTLERLHKSIIIEHNIGREIYRLLIASNEVVQGTIKTVKEGDPLYTKGRIKSFRPTAEMKKLAIDSMKAVNADLARIDLAHENGKLVVVNVVLKPSLVELSKDVDIVSNKILTALMKNYHSNSERHPLVKLFEGMAHTVKDVFEK